eukprot:TRINITY_DN3726_c0_g1_i1.p1 TRINITY_DN3726_c0_g1~~TRINITY_DN3726_c0_g1_i1.p1  ORF type:complete len:103 (+),score=16.87 TRINITY_DN3726_c0_g1_i1:213-521(+)
MALDGEDWKDVRDTELVHRVKTKFREELLTELIGPRYCDTREIGVKEVVERLIDYCVDVTRQGREWMEGHCDMALPGDYVTYPGKMDHTSVVCLKISGTFDR